MINNFLEGVHPQTYGLFIWVCGFGLVLMKATLMGGLPDDKVRDNPYGNKGYEMIDVFKLDVCRQTAFYSTTYF